MVPRVVEDILDALDGQRRIVCDLSGQATRLGKEGLPVLRQMRDEAHPQGLLGGEIAARQGQLPAEAVADQAGEALEGAEVRHDADLRLPDRKDGIPGGQADVAGAGHVDAAADAVAVDGGDDGHAAPVDDPAGSLQLQYSPPEPLAAESGTVPEDFRPGIGQVEPHGKAGPFRPDDNDADFRVRVDGGKGRHQGVKEGQRHPVAHLRTVEDQPEDGTFPLRFEKTFIDHHPASFHTFIRKRSVFSVSSVPNGFKRPVLMGREYGKGTCESMRFYTKSIDTPPPHHLEFSRSATILHEKPTARCRRSATRPV